MRSCAAVAWSEVFPWLMLVRALRLATSAPLLLVATVGVLLLPPGWQVARLLLDESAVAPVAHDEGEKIGPRTRSRGCVNR